MSRHADGDAGEHQQRAVDAEVDLSPGARGSPVAGGRAAVAPCVASTQVEEREEEDPDQSRRGASRGRRSRPGCSSRRRNRPRAARTQDPGDHAPCRRSTWSAVEAGHHEVDAEEDVRRARDHDALGGGRTCPGSSPSWNLCAYSKYLMTRNTQREQRWSPRGARAAWLRSPICAARTASAMVRLLSDEHHGVDARPAAPIEVLVRLEERLRSSRLRKTRVGAEQPAEEAGSP